MLTAGASESAAKPSHTKLNYLILLLPTIYKNVWLIPFGAWFTLVAGVVMPTERQSESARINGAKSRGPQSAEGKKKSSRNSLRHGCTAGHTILLACEDRGELQRMPH